MGRPAAEGESPVDEVPIRAEQTPEYGGARGILPESSWTITKG